MQLNRHQQKAAQSTAPVLVVRAGAGTGKTTMLVARCRHLAECFPYVRLAAFTRAAAATLRERVDETCGELAECIVVDTLHGFASSVCRHGLDMLTGFSKGWSIIDGPESKAIDKQAKKAGVKPEALRRRHGLVSYDELLKYALEILPTTDRFKGGALLVDEAQDLTPIEWRLVEAMEPLSLTVVGDPAQAIYGWRGAVDTALVNRYEAGKTLRSLAGAEWLTLPTNYRAPQLLCDVANRLKIPGQVDLVSAVRQSCFVETRKRLNDTEHVEAVVAGVFRNRLAGLGWSIREHPERWAFLSRTKARLDVVAEILKAHNIPTRGLEGKAWETQSARSLIDLLRVVHSKSVLHIDRVLERCGVTRFQRLQIDDAVLAPNGKPLWPTLCDAALPGGLIHDTQAHHTLFALNNLMAEPTTARRAASALVRSGAAPRVCPWKEIPEGLSLDEFFFWLASPKEQAEYDEPAVTLSTIHGAKGLEWDNVVVLGCEEDHMPMVQKRKSKRDQDAYDAEERRIFYVAVTRAARMLILASSEQRPGFNAGHMIRSEPSRFLQEVLR